MTAIFRDTYQHGLFTILFSAGSDPLRLWEPHIKDGSIARVMDPEIKTLVINIRGANVSTTFIKCPKGKDTLGIYLPFMVMIVKNLKKYWTFEVTIKDETDTNRRFRVANFQSSTIISPRNTAMPIGLSDGWNQIQFNLADFTRRAYNKQFVEVVSVRINANIRIRRIYFTERLVPENELPNDYRLFIPLENKQKHRKSQVTENVDRNLPKEEIKESSEVEDKENTAEIKKSEAQGKSASQHEMKSPSKTSKSKHEIKSPSRISQSEHKMAAPSRATSSSKTAPSQHEMKSPSKTTPSQHEMKSPSKTTPSQHEMKSPSKTTPSQHEMKSPSKTTSSQHELKSPSKTTPSQHEMKSPSKTTPSQHEMKSPSKTTPSQHEVKSPSKTTPSQHEMKSPSKTTPSQHEMKSPSKTTPSQHEMKSPSKTTPSQHEMKSPSKTTPSHHEIKEDEDTE